eukprot:scaffold158991_cov36-Tisochrysis_lutea.AAC.3
MAEGLPPLAAFRSCSCSTARSSAPVPFEAMRHCPPPSLAVAVQLDSPSAASAMATPEPIDSPHSTRRLPRLPSALLRSRIHLAAARPSSISPFSVGEPDEPPYPR